MAASWWKYGLCIFGGLGVGYIVGVKLTKDKAEKEYESKIDDIREIYRNDRRANAPKKNEEKKTDNQPEMTTKTSIQMEKLSQKREKADNVLKTYGKAFEENKRPDSDASEEVEETEEPKDNWSDYVHIVDEFPEDTDYRDEVLDYYSDGVLAYDITGQRIPDNEVKHYVGEKALQLLEADDCNEVLVMNDLYRINYTIIFRYQEYAQVLEEEPYKAEL